MMACNVAVSITKGVLANEQMFRLLPPETVAHLIEAVLVDMGYTQLRHSLGQNGSVLVNGGYYTPAVTITVAGAITVVNDDRGLVLAAVKALIQGAAEIAFDQRILDALGKMAGKSATIQEVQAEENGQTFTASVMRVTF